MDKLEHRLIQLKIQREAVKKDDDEAAKKQLALLSADIDKVEKEFADLDEVWKAEKATLHGSAQIKSDLEQAKLDLEAARRSGDLTKMSELQYGVIPDMEKRLASADAAEHGEMQLLRNKVSDEEVAEVVSRWTGIPISKMLEGEKDKLLRMEEALHKRVVGQGEAVDAVSNAVRRSRAGLRTRIAPMARSCSWGQPVWVKPSCARRWQPSCMTVKRRWFVSICRSLWRSTPLLA